MREISLPRKHLLHNMHLPMHPSIARQRLVWAATVITVRSFGPTSIQIESNNLLF